MADRLTERPSAVRKHHWAGLRVRWRLTSWWLRVLIVWLASRLVTTGLLLWFAARQEANQFTGAHPGYLRFASMWDGNWYHIIAVYGYPRALPLTVDGHVTENAWAFLPGYPAVVRAVMTFGLGWEAAAVLVSVVFSLAAALMLYRLMRLVLPGGSALFAVTLFCVAPLSPILQVAYPESMQAFLLALALYLLLRRRYWWLIPVVAVLSLTRPSGLAFAFALALHVGYRWTRRGKDPFPAAQRTAALTATAASTVMGIAWSLIAWAVTGSAAAYTDTELAWRMPYLGYHGLVPFTPWLQGANFWLPFPFGPFALVVLVVGFAALLWAPPVRRLGVDLRFWSASYSLYLLAVFFPQSSTFRLLMPLFPLLGALARPRASWYRASVVVLFVAGQWVWVYLCWWVNGYDWSPP